MPFFIIAIISNLEDILGFLLFFFTTYGWSDISFSYDRTKPFTLSLVPLLLLFFLDFLRRFFGLEALFDLICLIFGLQCNITFIYGPTAF